VATVTCDHLAHRRPHLRDRRRPHLRGRRRLPQLVTVLATGDRPCQRSPL
ncbi:hypothetical protein BHE74_00049097, partial [Ensete ventricosum]